MVDATPGLQPDRTVLKSEETLPFQQLFHPPVTFYSFFLLFEIKVFPCLLMLVGPELKICLTQDLEWWTSRRTPHIFQEGGRNRILAAKVLPLLFSQEGTHTVDTHPPHRLILFPEDNPVWLHFFCKYIV